MTIKRDEVPVAQQLQLPIEPYEVSGYAFGQRVRSRKILWARHLADDVVADSGRAVVAIGEGLVVWHEMRRGSQEKRNWGGLIVVAHRHKATDELFFSLYGHITDLRSGQRERIAAGQQLGVVAPGLTPENGYWKIPHLHFGLYVGPWMEQVLPGYARPFEKRTKFSWWREPKPFIERYNEE